MKTILFDGELKLVDSGLEGDYPVLAVGICGTDISMIKGSYKPRKFPLILGHEFSLEVDGKIKTSEINIVDWTCYYCRKGMYTHCSNRKAIGIDLDGAMRQRISVPSYLLHNGTDSPITSAVVEPMAAVLRMVELLRVSPEEEALVLGDGPLGIMSALVLSRLGLHVELKGRNKERLRVAMDMGLQVTYSPSSYDIVIEATGGNAVEEALSHVKPMGKIGLKSTHGMDVKLNQTKVAVEEITLIGSRCGPFYLWDKAVSLAKELHVEDMIRVYPLPRFRDAFRDVMERKVVKAVLDMEGK